MNNAGLTHYLSAKPKLLMLWCIVAAFGIYFCTYAFRKPFSAGTYQQLTVFGIGYKTVLIITQVLGYMLSKFLGIKVISELKKASRVKLIFFLLAVAQLSLVLFGAVARPYNFIFLFFNGLPLGMVWGVVFSFLEGRRFTEFIAMGLSINMIMTSGILKTFYLYLAASFGYSEFQLPAIIGFMFMLPVFVFVWMLSVIPEPSKAEISLRMKRKPMTSIQKKWVWINYAPGLVCIILPYAMLTTLRDYRDNFMVEIWQGFDPSIDNSIFAKTEMLIAFFVMAAIALLVFIKDNKKAYWVISATMILSVLSLLAITLFFKIGSIDAFTFFVIMGICFYLPYLIVQIAYFERLIGFLRLKANAGYFVYLCDSIGYLGSVLLLIYNEFGMGEYDFTGTLIKMTLLTSVLSIAMLLGQFVFYRTVFAKKKGSLQVQQTADAFFGKSST